MRTKKGTSLDEWLKEEERRTPGFIEATKIGTVRFRIAQVVYDARTGAGLTQAQLAKRIHTHQGAIARIESAEQNVTVEMLEKIARAVGGRFEGRIVLERR